VVELVAPLGELVEDADQVATHCSSATTNSGQQT
jgi:hypothetical protein